MIIQQRLSETHWTARKDEETQKIVIAIDDMSLFDATEPHERVSDIIIEIERKDERSNRANNRKRHV